MIVKTKNRTLKVLIKHKKKEELRHGKLTTHQTDVIIKTAPQEGEGQQLLQATSYCSENDNHSRLQGRKWALQKAFESDKGCQILSKEERTAIFKTLCARLTNGKKN
jgi:hypothetical protein